MQVEVQPIIYYNLCTNCGLCVIGCPEDALQMTSKGPVLHEPTKCTYCTDCENLCPTGAIRTPLTVSWRENTEI
jgi:NAD-dependent dihydropyrimidine dehydrogenase PreA subunit